MRQRYTPTAAATTNRSHCVGRAPADDGDPGFIEPAAAAFANCE
jgi:hypothetical protein